MASKADTYIDQVHHLLPAPGVALRLLELVNSSSSSSQEIVDLISRDPSLTANVLKVSNSSFYGAERKIDSLTEAVMRVGFREIYRLVAAISCGPMLSHSSKRNGREATGLLDHSLAAATAAQFLSKDLGENDNLAFTAALLHDIGKIVIGAVSESFYTLTQGGQTTETDLLVTEQRVLGVTHAELGARLLERWQFPDSLVMAIQSHHRPASANSHPRLACILNLGNAVAYQLGHGFGHTSAKPDITLETCNFLALPTDRLSGYLDLVSKRLASGAYPQAQDATKAPA